MRGDEISTSLSVRNWGAALFDLDGVLTDTTRVHTAAWQALFDEVLRRLAAGTGRAVRPFDPRADYLAHVDGRRREVPVPPFGDRSREPGRLRVHADVEDAVHAGGRGAVGGLLPVRVELREVKMGVGIEEAHRERIPVPRP